MFEMQLNVFRIGSSACGKVLSNLSSESVTAFFGLVCKLMRNGISEAIPGRNIEVRRLDTDIKDAISINMSQYKPFKKQII
jgi:hypothetical protein